MKRIAVYFIVFLPIISSSQIKTDTIFSGRSLRVDISDSILNKLNQSIDIQNMCRDQEKIDPDYRHLMFQQTGHEKAHVPYLLQEYSNMTGTKVLQEYDVLLYSSYCGTLDSITETYLLEFYFKDENQAKQCINVLKKLINMRKDKESLDSELLLGTYNWFFMTNKNKVYFVHRNIPDNQDNQITNELKNKILAFNE